MPAKRFLFCCPTMQLSGGVKTILELADRLVDAGQQVDLFSWAGPPAWRSTRARFLAAHDLAEIDMSRYEFVVVSNAFLIPMVLPRLDGARCVFLALDYESYHHGRERTYASFMAESPVIAALYRLPVPIITESRPLQRLIAQRTGKRVHYMAVGIDKQTFRPQPPRAPGRPRRVLAVANYLMPYKGIPDLLEALRELAAEVEVQLVLATQEWRGRRLFDGLPFPVEVHFCPPEPHMPAIIGSCDVVCCASWYEGLGLPAIEAFHCGRPVVSTKTLGVYDYGLDGVNLLLAEPNNPPDLADKLRSVITDRTRATRLCQEGLKTTGARFLWSDSITRFLSAIAEIEADGPQPSVDPAELEALLPELERVGAFTPIEVYRRYEALDLEFNAVCSELRGGGAPSQAQLTTLASIRDALAQYLNMPDAQYYEAFKARFDLCRLLLKLGASPATHVHIPLVLSRRHRAAASTALVEHHYPER